MAKNRHDIKLLCSLILLKVLVVWAEEKPPHIFFLVADDLGWNDISWNNPEIKTPNLEVLARNGVILNQSYVLPLCTPSRTAFMTGYYPFRTGMQNSVINILEPTGVPLKFTFLPEKLKTRGYATHLIGKWHLGMCNWSYTPTFRGFDSFFGYYSGTLDYYNYSNAITNPQFPFEDFDQGPYYYDFRRNTSAELEPNGTYAVEVYKKAIRDTLSGLDPNKPLFMDVSFMWPHFPLEVPKEYEDLYPNIHNNRRRKFSGMITAMDDVVGSLVSDLKKYKFWDNSVIIFTSDNGGNLLEMGNNFPLRGGKLSLWEGGTRAVGFVHSNKLSKKGYVSNKLIHAVDWFPTIMHLAGIKENFEGDGVNQWNILSKDPQEAARHTMVYNIFDTFPPHAAIRIGDYKLIQGMPEESRCVVPVPKDNNYTITSITSCNDYGGNSSQLLLFDLSNDPSESHNIATDNPQIVQGLYAKLNWFTTQAVPALEPPLDPAGIPVNTGIFTPGWCVAK